MNLKFLKAVLTVLHDKTSYPKYSSAVKTFLKTPLCIVILVKNLQTIFPNFFQQFMLVEILTNGDS